MSTFKYSIGSGETRISFLDKPGEEIRSFLKGAGFRWSPSAACWWRRGYKGAADFLAALERRMNPGRPDGACWRCKSAQGFFRPQGAATPVYCNACWDYVEGKPPKAERGEEVPRIDRFDLDYEDRCREACGL